jgi:glycine cleavage system H lipoate-binding protein/TusA-related sulfurtransferase
LTSNGFLIDNCLFPTDYLYDLENMVWIKFVNKTNAQTGISNEFLIGITPVYAYITGKITNLKVKPIGSLIERNKSIGSVESLVHFGIIRSPLKGKIVEINERAMDNPKVVNDSPFGNGWIAKIKATNDHDVTDFAKKIDDCKDDLLAQIRKYHVKCFKLFPDFQMFEIGTECSATLAKLDEFMENSMQKGQVIRLVSDDPTADLELLRWADQNHQEIVEILKEKNKAYSSSENNGEINLFNIIIRKKEE